MSKSQKEFLSHRAIYSVQMVNPENKVLSLLNDRYTSGLISSWIEVSPGLIRKDKL